jgi:aldose 1-epimerase
MKIQKDFFGNTGKEIDVFLYILSNDNGVEVKITNYGATVTSIKAPDKFGKIDEIVAGFDSLESYEMEHPFFGAICGRYANRIAKGTFSIEGETFHLPVNDGPNCLHGGNKGFNRVIWNSEPVETKDYVGVKLSYFSKDGEEGFPGNLTVEVIYSLNNKNELSIVYNAVTDKTTVVNLTNHSYFNPDGCQNTIYDLLVTINADKYTEIDNTSIPTGKLIEVTNTPFDFRKPAKLGERITAIGGGFDHNFVLNKKTTNDFSFAATVFSPSTGRKIDVFTTEPGVQFYTANFLDGSLKGHNDIYYKKHCSLCLETQHFPDSPNHPAFPSTLLKKGEKYYQKTIYSFNVEK